MIVANELLQWAVLVFLAVFVLGLTRQLGMFLVPRPVQIEEQGPAIGQKLSTDLISSHDAIRVAGLIAESSASAAALIVIDENCSVCRALVADLGRRAPGLPRRDELPVAALVKSSSDEFEQQVSQAVPVVITDRSGAASAKAGLIGTPFIMVVDADMRVRARRLSADLDRVVKEWLVDGRRSERQAEAADSTAANRDSTLVSQQTA